MNNSCKIDRNKEIMLRVLLGSTFKSVGKEYGITGNAVRLIFLNTLKQTNPEIYKESSLERLEHLKDLQSLFAEMTGLKITNRIISTTPDVRWLRKNKDRIIYSFGLN